MCQRTLSAVKCYVHAYIRSTSLPYGQVVYTGEQRARCHEAQPAASYSGLLCLKISIYTVPDFYYF